MEIASIKGDTVQLLFHPKETLAEVGQQFLLEELPSKSDGLIVQVISNDSLEYVGLQQEMIQSILAKRASTHPVINREIGMGEMKSLKVATAKIRKRVKESAWHSWDGWIPTRHVQISRVTGHELTAKVLPKPRVPLDSFCRFDEAQIQFDGPNLNMVNVVAGVKGSGKSHLTKHLVCTLSKQKVPCIVYDMNGEYSGLPKAKVLRWGGNFRPALDAVGYDGLRLTVMAVYPLQENSQNAFESSLPVIFARRREACAKEGRPFTIDIPFLREQKWSNNSYVHDAITERLRVIDEHDLYRRYPPPQAANANQANKQRNANQQNNLPEATPEYFDFDSLYNEACNGNPMIFDMTDMSASMQQALVKSTNRAIETICRAEASENGGGRFPFVFYEEAHFYVSTEAILNIITRGRHIGMASVFVTNTPQHLPDTVFRQLDNLFLLSLSHKDDIRNVSKNSFTDEETIECFATRMPPNHALIIGNVTQKYPLVVRVEDLAGVPRSGQTKSTWDRLIKSESASA